MEYATFKNVILAELVDFYEKDIDVITVRKMRDADGQYYEGLDISMRDSEDKENHIVNLSALYDRYITGSIDLYDCVEIIYREREGQNGNSKRI